MLTQGVSSADSDVSGRAFVAVFHLLGVFLKQVLKITPGTFFGRQRHARIPGRWCSRIGRVTEESVQLRTRLRKCVPIGNKGLRFRDKVSAKIGAFFIGNFFGNRLIALLSLITVVESAEAAHVKIGAALSTRRVTTKRPWPICGRFATAPTLDFIIHIGPLVISIP